MQFTITKEFRFEAAHRLVKGYCGKCANIHGHSWVVRVTLGSDKLNHHDMVRDFGEVKPLRQWVDDTLDHATIVSSEDKDLQLFCDIHNQRMYCVGSENPTSEVLARVIFKKAVELNLDPVAVEIDETCTSNCRYQG